MAIEHADSFDIYGTDASLMTEGVYAEVTTGFGGGPVGDPDGLSTQRCLFLNGGNLRYALLTPTDVVGVALRLWMPALPTNGENEVVPFMFSNIDNTVIASVGVQSNGAMALRMGTGGDATTSTNVPVVTAEAWWHLEVRIDVNTGTLELRVEGEAVLELEDLVFSDAVIYQVRSAGEVAPGGFTTPFYDKDLVIWNDLGTDNVDFLGPVRVINCTPNADDTLGGWDPVGDTTGFPILANNPPLNTEYLVAAPAAVGDFMEYELTAIPDDITSVKAVVTFVRARKIDGGYGQLQTSMVGTAAAESHGADRPITAGYVYWRDVHERDPGTDTQWTRIAVNAAKIKIDRTL